MTLRRSIGSLPTVMTLNNEEYRQLVANEMLDTKDICKSLLVEDFDDSVSEEQVKEAMGSMNRGKSADI